MIGRPWERDRLRLEMGSHRPCSSGAQTLHCVANERALFGRQQIGGRQHKNDSTPISFIFGEKINSDETEPNEVNGVTVDGIGVKTEPVTSPKTDGGQTMNSALENIDWLNNSPQKSGVILRMMSTMGYEHGRGLGKNGQGIVEPIKPNPNPGKRVLGADHHSNRRGPKESRGRRYHREREGGRNVREQMDTGKDNTSADNRRQWDNGEGRPPHSSRKAQMHYEDNVKGTLRSVGHSEQSAEEVWQALGVLAKNKIMPLGMGLGLVKKRAGRMRIEAEEEGNAL